MSLPSPAAGPGELFVGRERELAFLEELWASGRPELFVLWGRRRVGKTELLQRFCQEKRAVYFLAAQVREKDNLRAFKSALSEALDDPLADRIDFPDWGAALAYAVEKAGGERLALVLDEFPYLCEANKGLPSELQRFWDTKGKKSPLLLVLCGSQVAFMEKEVLAERSPLFGRRTGQRRLEPLEPAETLPFFPRWEMRERVLAYAVLGGMPAYLGRFDDRRTLAENLARETLRPEAYLFEEVQFLLRSELTSPATYASILAAVAQGARKLSEIALEVGVDSTTANKYLSVLRELHLVEREVPLSDPNPLRSRRGSYRIADRFLAYHFRHLVPNLSLIHAGRGARVLEESVLPDLPRLYDEARVDFVLAHLRREAADLVGEEIVEAGRHDGSFVRALARTASGAGVAAIVLPEPEAGAKRSADLAPLAEELRELAPLFRGALRHVTYDLTRDPERPLHAELVPEGELL
jgi:AAA+ ATPase superfamily predicted ATPase